MDIYEKFFANTLNFLSYRPRSEKEVRDHLFSKNPLQNLFLELFKNAKIKDLSMTRNLLYGGLIKGMHLDQEDLD